MKKTKNIEKLVEDNLGLVHMVLKRFSNRGYDREELFMTGSEGLVKAAVRFEPEKGFSFSTYAVPMIIGEIKRFIRDDGMIHISRKIKSDARTVAAAREQLQMSENCENLLKKIEEITGLSKQDIIIAMESENSVTNIDNESVLDFYELKSSTLVPETDKVVNKIMLQQAIKNLSDEDKKIIYFRYSCEKTQSEVADIIGKNQVYVSRREKYILIKMREFCCR